MSSHVVIIDSTFRRTNIKCAPNTYLSDVLAEACLKLNLRPEQYGFKYNKKVLDLSHTFRLSGLPPGAQLELVQLSRTATPVNVALQLPASENNVRLTDKFPSTTSLWQILRSFESGAAGGRSPSNFTQRGLARQQNGSSGAGRMYYETPVLNVMGRELASFVDLQKTLVQLGVTSGSALLRLSFKPTDQPLEKAMVEISDYFKTTDPSGSNAEAPEQSQPPESRTAGSEEALARPRDSPPSAQTLTTSTPTDTNSRVQESASELASASPSPSAADTSGQRPVKVFLPPTASAPAAATQPYNENDYVPTIEHAKLHQARLNNAGRNQRLLSDVELATREAERQAKLKAVDQVKVRIRFPDQTTVETAFGKADRGHDVYEFAKGLMVNGGEPFFLTYVGSKAEHVSLRDGPQKLIADDGWRGNMLINLIWDEGVPAHVKKQPILREAISSQAVPMTVNPAYIQEESEQRPEKPSGGIFGQQKNKDGDRQKGVEAKLKGFLGLGKKK